MTMIRLDRVGMSMMLKSAGMAAVISDTAEAVASNARSNAGVQKHAAEVAVETYTTDRAAAAVLIKHPIGLGIQAKYGALTQAAGSQGLEVRTDT